jgi:hypothetical protein
MLFTPEDILARLQRRPFRPLRIIASEGLRYDIRHPDLVLVGERELTIGLPKVDDRPVYDRQIWIPLLHIVGMEDLPQPIEAAAAA